MCVIDFIRDNANFFIAIAAFVQAVFAFYLWRVNRQQRDIAKFMSIFNRYSYLDANYRDIQKAKVSQYDGPNVDPPWVEKQLKEDIEITYKIQQKLEKKMLGKKLSKLLYKNEQASIETKQSDTT
jgi:hypothetical protein